MAAYFPDASFKEPSIVIAHDPIVVRVPPSSRVLWLAHLLGLVQGLHTPQPFISSHVFFLEPSFPSHSSRAGYCLLLVLADVSGHAPLPRKW